MCICYTLPTCFSTISSAGQRSYPAAYSREEESFSSAHPLPLHQSDSQQPARPSPPLLPPSSLLFLFPQIFAQQLDLLFLNLGLLQLFIPHLTQLSICSEREVAERAFGFGLGSRERHEASRCLCASHVVSPLVRDAEKTVIQKRK